MFSGVVMVGIVEGIWVVLLGCGVWLLVGIEYVLCFVG